MIVLFVYNQLCLHFWLEIWVTLWGLNSECLEVIEDFRHNQYRESSLGTTSFYQDSPGDHVVIIGSETKRQLYKYNVDKTLRVIIMDPPFMQHHGHMFMASQDMKLISRFNIFIYYTPQVEAAQFLSQIVTICTVTSQLSLASSFPSSRP